MKSNNTVVNYYQTLESKLGYRWLHGVKHFGYFPIGKDGISNRDAQMLMNEQLAKTLELPKQSVVLDAGCGEGGVAFYLAEKYCLNVRGIDLLDFNIRRARKEASKKDIDPELFQVGTYMNLPFSDNTFDGLYTMETLVHAPDYKKALLEFYRVLKPGGKLVLFEYTITPESQVADKSALKAIREVNEFASMPAFNVFEHDTFNNKLSIVGFGNIIEKDITKRMLPMLRRFYLKARLPYCFIKRLGLKKHFVNTMSAVEFYKHQDIFRYVIVSAVSKK